MLIGQRQGKQLTNRQWGILTNALHGKRKPDGFMLHDGDWTPLRHEYEALQSEGLLTIKRGPQENCHSFEITEMGKSALRNRPRRIVMPGHGAIPIGKDRDGPSS